MNLNKILHNQTRKLFFSTTYAQFVIVTFQKYKILNLYLQNGIIQLNLINLSKVDKNAIFQRGKKNSVCMKEEQENVCVFKIIKSQSNKQRKFNFKWANSVNYWCSVSFILLFNIPDYTNSLF